MSEQSERAASLLQDEHPGWVEPVEVSDLDLAFPAKGVELCPLDVTAEKAWERLSTHLWSEGIDGVFLLPRPSPSNRPNPDESPAALSQRKVRHLQVVLGCHDLSHGDKITGAAYLLQTWFEAAAYPLPTGQWKVIKDDLGRDEKYNSMSSAVRAINDAQGESNKETE